MKKIYLKLFSLVLLCAIMLPTQYAMAANTRNFPLTELTIKSCTDSRNKYKPSSVPTISKKNAPLSINVFQAGNGSRQLFIDGVYKYTDFTILSTTKKYNGYEIAINTLNVRYNISASTLNSLSNGVHTVKIVSTPYNKFEDMLIDTFTFNLVD